MKEKKKTWTLTAERYLATPEDQRINLFKHEEFISYAERRKLPDPEWSESFDLRRKANGFPPPGPFGGNGIGVFAVGLTRGIQKVMNDD